MADIQTQLRKNELTTDYQSLQYWRTLCKEAADALDAQAKEIVRLRKVLTVITEVSEENWRDWTTNGCSPADAIDFVWETGRRSKEALSHDR